MNVPAQGGRGSTVPDRPAPRADVETAFLSPEAVLYDSRSATVVHLNGSAAAVWMLLDGATDVDTLTAELSDVFGLPADTLRPDVDAVLASLARRDLLVEGG